MFDLNTWAWIQLILASMLIGVGKGAFPGASLLAVGWFALIVDSRASIGLVLPVLTMANTVSAVIYFKKVYWRGLWRVMPMTLVGMAIGYWIMQHMSKSAMRPVIGGILLGLTSIHFIRAWWVQNMQKGEEDGWASKRWFSNVIGIIAGIATLMANSAGPITVLYLMALRLPKYQFIATSVWFFFIVNFIKFPFQIKLGIMTMEALKLSIPLGIVASCAVFFGPKIVKHVPQKTFNIIVWSFVIFAGLRLVI